MASLGRITLWNKKEYHNYGFDDQICEGNTLHPKEEYNHDGFDRQIRGVGAMHLSFFTATRNKIFLHWFKKRHGLLSTRYDKKELLSPQQVNFWAHCDVITWKCYPHHWPFVMGVGMVADGLPSQREFILGIWGEIYGKVKSWWRNDK